MSSNSKDEEPSKPQPISLFDISWEDVLYSHLLPYLSWEDLFHLRASSVQSKQLVDEYWAQLRTLNLHYNRLPNGRPMLPLPFQIAASGCSKLRTLILTDNSRIRDPDLSSVFKGNRLLSHVDLSGCLGLTGTSLLPLAVYCKELAVLKVRGCNWMSRGIMETLMTHLRGLREVDLSSCSALSNSQIVPFVQTFPGLRVIRLASLQSVNDATLVHVARHCLSLKHLDIRACVSVTDNGIRNLAEYSSKLTGLEVAHCHKVSENSLVLLRRRGNVRIDRPAWDAGIPPLRCYVQV